MRKSDSGVFLQILTAAALSVIILVSINAYKIYQNRIYREKAHLISCRSNLKQIGIAMKLYSGDYSDNFPQMDNSKGMECLRINAYLTDYKVFICPSTSATCPPKDTSLTESFSSYIYFSGFKETDPPDMVLAMDKIGNHASRKINFICLDGIPKGEELPFLPKSYEEILKHLYATKPKKFLESTPVKKQLEKAREFDSQPSLK